MAVHVPGIWGIDLGQCALKAIRLQMVEGEVTATAFDYVEHPKLLNQPDADPDELTREALQQFLSRNTLRGDMVIISVPGQSGLARFVKLPPVEEKKIADIVRFEAKQQIPFPLDEVVWDYQKIGTGVVTDGFAMETEIGLFAMKRDMVNRAIQQLKDVNVEVHVVQMAPLALCNYVAFDLLGKDGVNKSAPAAAEGEEAEKPEKAPCVVALDIGTDSSNLVITDGDKIIWQRPIPLGGNHFTRVLTKDMKLTFAKAEHLKRNAVKSPDLKKILSSLKSVLNDFVGEVQRSLGYFTNTHRDATIQYMIGLGNAFRLPGLQKYLQEKLQLEVRKLTQLERVKGEAVLTAPTFSENLLSFGVAYGLALQGLEKTRLQTNLLPYEIRVERLVRGKKPWAAAAAAALLLAVAGLALGRSMEKAAVDNSDPGIRKGMDSVTKSIKNAEDLISKFNRETDLINASQASIRRIGSGAEERFNWQHLYQYLNLALPQVNGDKVVDLTIRKFPARETYVTADAKRAFDLLEKKRFAKGPPTDAKAAAEEDDFIKKHLIQVNIEGVTALWTDDLGTYFHNIYVKEKLLRGMNPKEREVIVEFNESEGKTSRDVLPKSGWVVEIRGYTYHVGTKSFVENTIAENLANPLAKGVNPDLPGYLQEEVYKKMSYLFLFRNEVVSNPDPVRFKHIHQSYVKELLQAEKGGAAFELPEGVVVPAGGKDKKRIVNRNGWRPMKGTIAEAAIGGGGVGVRLGKDANPGQGSNDGPMRQARTEFVILFVWKEPLPTP